MAKATEMSRAADIDGTPQHSQSCTCESCGATIFPTVEDIRYGGDVGCWATCHECHAKHFYFY